MFLPQLYPFDSFDISFLLFIKCNSLYEPQSYLHFSVTV